MEPKEGLHRRLLPIERGWARASSAVLLGATVSLLACDRDDPQPSKPTASAPAPTASVPAEPPAPWYEGKWSGSYTAKPHRIEVAKGQGLPEWNVDAGVGEEKGPIELQVSEDGKVSGELKGPLGPLELRGEVHENTLRARLSSPPTDAGDALHGFVVAERADETMSGELRASTAGSTKVRSAKVKLKKD